MADFIDPTVAVDVPPSTAVTVAPSCRVTVTVAATHRGHSIYRDRTVTALAGQTIDVPDNAAVELRAAGLVL